MSRTQAEKQNLTDEEILEEFVKRFQCDGAILIYLDSGTEFGFGRWRNSSGRRWVSSLFKQVKQVDHVNLVELELEDKATTTLPS